MRREQVEYDLPELIDLLVVTVEAGLGFNGSLQLAPQRIPGPLGQELRLALQEQAMGLSTSEALKNMLIRCDTQSVRRSSGPSPRARRSASRSARSCATSRWRCGSGAGRRRRSGPRRRR